MALQQAISKSFLRKELRNDFASFPSQWRVQSLEFRVTFSLLKMPFAIQENRKYSF